MDLPSASVLCLQISLPLFFVVDMSQPRLTVGIYQVIAVAQQAGDRPAPDFLHGMLFKKDIAPDAVFNIGPATGDGQMNVRMPVELSAVGVQGAEDTDLNTLFAGHQSMAQMAARNRALRSDQLLLKKGHSRRGIVKVMCCQSQSGRMWLCCATHCSVALCPQALQTFDLQFWQRKRE